MAANNSKGWIIGIIIFLIIGVVLVITGVIPVFGKRNADAPNTVVGKNSDGSSYIAVDGLGITTGIDTTRANGEPFGVWLADRMKNGWKF